MELRCPEPLRNFGIACETVFWQFSLEKYSIKFEADIFAVIEIHIFVFWATMQGSLVGVFILCYSYCAYLYSQYNNQQMYFLKYNSWQVSNSWCRNMKEFDTSKDILRSSESNSLVVHRMLVVTGLQLVHVRRLNPQKQTLWNRKWRRRQ